nr:hypothetical protein GCM10020093_068080 [Planobispora longispora]
MPDASSETTQNIMDRIDPSVPHPARVYDYWLGGKDHFASDRAVGDEILAVMPGLVTAARAEREFLGRSVRHLAGDPGVRQFLDVGTGIPTANNTHEVAQRVAPESRIVYVDNDPVVLNHARALLRSTPREPAPTSTRTCASPKRSWGRPPKPSTSTCRSRSCCWASWSSSPTRSRRWQRSARSSTPCPPAAT